MTKSAFSDPKQATIPHIVCSRSAPLSTSCVCVPFVFTFNRKQPYLFSVLFTGGEGSFRVYGGGNPWNDCLPRTGVSSAVCCQCVRWQECRVLLVRRMRTGILPNCNEVPYSLNRPDKITPCVRSLAFFYCFLGNQKNGMVHKFLQNAETRLALKTEKGTRNTTQSLAWCCCWRGGRTD